MAEQAVQDAGGAPSDAEAKGGMSGKKIVLFVVLPLLLLIGGLAGAYFAGLFDSLLGKGEEAEAHSESEASEQSVFFELPVMLVNLNSGGQKTAYLKISIALEVTSEADASALRTVLPRIVDNFQVYMRELRVEDLRGSAGLQRLREELLLRVNSAVEDVEVMDVLFKEMLVQ